MASGHLLEQQGRPAGGPGREVHEKGRPHLRRRTHRVPHVGRSREADALRHRDHRAGSAPARSEEHTSELQSRENLVCRLLLEKKKKKKYRKQDKIKKKNKKNIIEK